MESRDETYRPLYVVNLITRDDKHVVRKNKQQRVKSIQWEDIIKNNFWLPFKLAVMNRREEYHNVTNVL